MSVCAAGLFWGAYRARAARPEYNYKIDRISIRMSHMVASIYSTFFFLNACIFFPALMLTLRRAASKSSVRRGDPFSYVGCVRRKSCTWMLSHNLSVCQIVDVLAEPCLLGVWRRQWINAGHTH